MAEPDFESLAFHEAMMREALEQARMALALDEVPVGAVITKGTEIVARAHNRTRTDRDPTAHAEILALRRAAQVLGDFRLTGHVMYVTLEPCAMCAGAIAGSRLSALWYGAFDEKLGCAGSVYHLPGDPALGAGVQTYPGLLSAECADLLRGFFQHHRQ